MSAAAWSADSITLYVRWLARGLSLLAAGMVALFFIAHGGVNPLTLKPGEAVQLAFFFMGWLGLLVAWRWELLGAVMTLGGIFLFYVANFVAVGRWPAGGVFAFLASPGVPFLYCGLRAWQARPRPAKE
jgi:hypothetical protein